MKAIIIALAVIILMIGAQSVSAEHTSNTMPPGSKSASGDDVSGFAKLSPGEHYGQCEEVGQDNHLACDVINESDLPMGYKQGIANAKSGQFAGNEITNRTGEFINGYILGYCSVNHTAQNSIPGFDMNCSQPLYPGN